MSMVVDTSASLKARLQPVPINAVKLEDTFWAPRLQMLQEVTLPSQYEILEETGRIDNFRRVSGKIKGEKGSLEDDIIMIPMSTSGLKELLLLWRISAIQSSNRLWKRL